MSGGGGRSRGGGNSARASQPQHASSNDGQLGAEGSHGGGEGAGAMSGQQLRKEVGGGALICTQQRPCRRARVSASDRARDVPVTLSSRMPLTIQHLLLKVRREQRLGPRTGQRMSQRFDALPVCKAHRCGSAPTSAAAVATRTGSGCQWPTGSPAAAASLAAAPAAFSYAPHTWAQVLLHRS